MRLNTVIFDMDGLLIDSEPLWEEAGADILAGFGIKLDHVQFLRTRGLRTREWLAFWFSHFNIDERNIEPSTLSIVERAIELIRMKGQALPGVDHIVRFFQEKNFKIGLATSSPHALIEVVIEKLNIAAIFSALTSAETLPYGKPHPQVFIDCAAALGSDPLQCICFEDSFNGMIAAKAAKMKCVVVPDPTLFEETRWGSSDLKLASLADFNERHLSALSS